MEGHQPHDPGRREISFFFVGVCCSFPGARGGGGGGGVT
jgi:hypothetical protein